MIETPGSVTFEISDVEHIVKIAKEHKIITVCDNSWATPLLFKPLDYGIDVALYALTKYIAGHSDLLMGAVVAEGEILNYFMKAIRIMESPFSRTIVTLHTGDLEHCIYA